MANLADRGPVSNRRADAKLAPNEPRVFGSRHCTARRVHHHEAMPAIGALDVLANDRGVRLERRRAFRACDCERCGCGHCLALPYPRATPASMRRLAAGSKGNRDGQCTAQPKHGQEQKALIAPVIGASKEVNVMQRRWCRFGLRGLSFPPTAYAANRHQAGAEQREAGGFGDGEGKDGEGTLDVVLGPVRPRESFLKQRRRG